MRNFGILLILGLFGGVVCAQTPQERFTRWVDPFIGTDALDSVSLPSNTFPGATVPFGLVQLSPDTDNRRYAECSGYLWRDSTIMGFSHTHVSGTGISDLFDILLLPVSGDLEQCHRNIVDNRPNYAHFSHQNEGASPGYYYVYLDGFGVKAELSATRSVGAHRYRYDNARSKAILVDLDHSLYKERRWLPFKTIDAQLRVVDPYTIEGYRIVTGWARLRKVCFSIQFSQPIASYRLYRGTRYYPAADLINGVDNRAPKAMVCFDPSGDVVEARVGISAVSVENARQNRINQSDGRSFDQIKAQADELWNRELGKIVVEGSDRYKKMFYSALYRNYIHPSDMADDNGQVMLPDFTVGQLPPATPYYTHLSLWDTYRATHPLLLLTQEQRVAQIINSMLLFADRYGYLPIWQLWGVENYCMIGNHAVSVIAEAFVKGLPGVDWERAYAAVKKSLTTDHANSSFFSQVEQYGFYPHDMGYEVASIHLENAYNDWCAQLMAQKLGKTQDAAFFAQRAATYRNIYDPKTGFFRPRMSDGTWAEPFDPFEYYGDGKKKYYTEANAFQYLFSVQHDVEGLIELMGGRSAFERRLDDLFSLPSPNGKIEENATGRIGQYAHGNEPSHHNAYLYSYIGKPEKSRALIRRIIDEQYGDSCHGISGNDDMGQTSAWLAFSMMGFYPMSPASGQYVLGVPLLDRVTIYLPNGKQFAVSVKNGSNTHTRVQSMVLNGTPYTSNILSHSTLMQGGRLEFVLARP